MRCTMNEAQSFAAAAAPRAQTPKVPRALDGLLELEPEALRLLYEGACAPRLADVRGDLRGRMLAWPAVRGLAARVLRALASPRASLALAPATSTPSSSITTSPATRSSSARS